MTDPGRTPTGAGMNWRRAVKFSCPAVSCLAVEPVSSCRIGLGQLNTIGTNFFLAGHRSRDYLNCPICCVEQAGSLAQR